MAPIRPDRVAIYIRWSTDDQGEGTTLDVQLDGCRHYALSQGWQHSPDLTFIDDGYSGGSLERPALTRLREAVQQGLVDCVVVFKIDRLSRNVVDTVNLVLREWDGKCHVKSAREAIDTATQQGKMFFYTLVSFAEWERSVIRERTWSGRLRRLQEGRNPGFRPPYGLRTGATPGSFELVPDEAAVVRRIFTLHARGLGYKAIATELGQAGIRFREGRPWSAQTVMAVLRNAIYTGRLVYGEQVVESAHLPRILADEQYEAAQERRSGRARERAPNRAVTSSHLLTGLLRCGRCGSAMMGRKKYGRGGGEEYYICAGQRSKGTAFCDSAYIRQRELDEWILDRVRERYAATEADLTGAMAELSQQVATAERAGEDVRRELGALDRELDVIGRDYRRERITAEEYREQRAQVERERERLSLRLEELAHTVAACRGRAEALPQAVKLAQHLDRLTLAEQKHILRELIHRLAAYRRSDTDTVQCDLVWVGRGTQGGG